MRNGGVPGGESEGPSGRDEGPDQSGGMYGRKPPCVAER
jgi:hypothetical protein